MSNDTSEVPPPPVVEVPPEPPPRDDAAETEIIERIKADSTVLAVLVQYERLQECWVATVFTDRNHGGCHGYGAHPVAALLDVERAYASLAQS